MFSTPWYYVKFDIQYMFHNRFENPSLTTPPEGNGILYTLLFEIYSKIVYMYAKFDIFYMFRTSKPLQFPSTPKAFFIRHKCKK